MNSSQRLLIRMEINLKETVRYLHRLRRSYLRRHSLTRTISASSHLLMQARLYLIYNRGSRKQMYRIYKLYMLSKSSKKLSAKEMNFAPMISGFNSMSMILKLMKLQNYLLRIMTLKKNLVMMIATRSLQIRKRRKELDF